MLTNIQKGLIALGINVVILAVCFKLIDIVDKKITNKIRSQESNSPLLRFLPILMKLLKVVLVFIAVTGILQSQGYSVSSIIAGFGIGGLAVGMAAKETIANVFGSISILSDRVYKIGDYVKVNNIEGYVEDINIRSTKIRDLDNFLITVPNNVAANAVITNVSKAKKRLLRVSFGVTYSTSNEKIKQAHEILKRIGTEHKDIHNDFTIAVHDMGESSINIRFMGYIKFLELVIKAFREAEIDFAFPSRSVYIESAKNEN